jgi:uncharacterized membrane protein
MHGINMSVYQAQPVTTPHCGIMLVAVTAAIAIFILKREMYLWMAKTGRKGFNRLLKQSIN